MSRRKNNIQQVLINLHEYLNQHISITLILPYRACDFQYKLIYDILQSNESKLYTQVYHR